MRVRQGLVQQVGSVVVAGAILLGAPGAARAQDATKPPPRPEDPARPAARPEDPARATALADAAAARAAQGARRVAIDLYEEAYAAAPRKEYLLQIGILYDNLAHGGDSRDVRLAILYLERFLAEPGPVPDLSLIHI